MRESDVSVVIPVYNGMETIEDALNSVLDQTAFRYVCEIIVVDDGSTDQNSGEHFEVIISECKDNHGVSAARNRGIKLSKGKYVAFLDADDEWMQNKLEIQLDILRKFPKIKVLGTGWDQLNLKPGKKMRNRSGYDIFRMSVKDELIYFWPSMQSVIAKRSELHKA